MIIPNAHLLMTAIEAHHPGGLRAFQSEGGVFCLIPHPFSELMIYHPELTQETRSALIKASEGMDVTVVFVTEKQEADREFAEAIAKKFSKAGFNAVDFAITPVSCIMQFPNVRIKDKRVAELKKLVKSVPGFVRAHVIFANDKDVWTLTDQERKAFKASAPREETKPNRLILEDDILNLRIDLETMDVDSFINSL